MHDIIFFCVCVSTLGVGLIFDSIFIHCFRFIVEAPVLSFICTYKLSQDHLELLFAIFRKRCGFGDNPTSQQFTTIYLKSLVHCELKTSFGTNCLSQDDTSILNVTKALQIQPNFMPSILEASDTDIENFERFQEDLEAEEENAKYVADVTYYVAGFVAKIIARKISCSTCKSFLVSPDQSSENCDLVLTKDRGGLHYASDTVELLCKTGESIVRKYECNYKLMDGNLVQKMVDEAKLEMPCVPFADNPDADDHGEHIDVLAEKILKEFFNIRLFHVARLKRNNIRKYSYRTRNRKTVHNAGF
jgi:hypothetical protein